MRARVRRPRAVGWSPPPRPVPRSALARPDRHHRRYVAASSRTHLPRVLTPLVRPPSSWASTRCLCGWWACQAGAMAATSWRSRLRAAVYQGDGAAVIALAHQRRHPRHRPAGPGQSAAVVVGPGPRLPPRLPRHGHVHRDPHRSRPGGAAAWRDHRAWRVPPLQRRSRPLAGAAAAVVRLRRGTPPRPSPGLARHRRLPKHPTTADMTPSPHLGTAPTSPGGWGRSGPVLSERGGPHQQGAR